MSIRLSLFLLCLMCLTAVVASAQEPLVDSELLALMNQDTHPWRGEQGEVTIWVFFTDKNIPASGMQEALDAAKKNLTRKAIARRVKGRKIHSYGAGVVNEMDLPLSPDYLAGVQALGGVKRAESRWLNAASFDVMPDQVRSILALPYVASIKPVWKFKRTPVATLPRDLPPQPEQMDGAASEKSLESAIDYGGSLGALQQINVPAVHAEGITGKGVLVGMMDTGFRMTHETLQHINVVNQWDFVGGDPIVDTQEGDPATSHYHGTMTLSTIAGYSPGQQVGSAYDIDVILARTEDVALEVPIEEDYWVAGLEWLEGQGVDIVSSSLGYVDWYVFEDLDGNTAVTTIAADIAAGFGVVVVNSAGNERVTLGHLIAPADGDSVITVGAVNILDEVTYFSSPGPTADGRIKPDVAALGAGVKVASPDLDDSYMSVAGTSFSCPLTSGVISLMLSGIPDLTPMQIREALRMTADRADDPDNDSGWGIVNAQAALHYFGPTFTHEPLGDTESTTSPYTVQCGLTDRLQLQAASLLLVYRIDGGQWISLQLGSLGGDQYAADIPQQASGTVVDYYLSARDVLDIQIAMPAQAPLDFFSFRVGPDLTPPVIVHTPLYDIPLQIWPPQIHALVTDNQGIASVQVIYEVNGSPQAPFDLLPIGGNSYAALIPVSVASLGVGDQIQYRIDAIDVAASSNSVTSGPWTFEIIESLGDILLVNDNLEAPAAATLKYDADKRIVPASETLIGDPAPDITAWLGRLGYVVAAVDWIDFMPEDLIGRDAVVLSCGSNESPVNGAMRDSLTAWTAAGGRLLIEGGETSYDALVWPEYPDFAQTCLRVSSWGGDTESDLTLMGSPYDHPLTHSPNLLPQNIPLQITGYADVDLGLPTAGTALLYGTAVDTRFAGLLAYDDNTAPQGGQIVNMSFNLAAITDTLTAQSLLANSMAYLLADEGQPTATLEGMVTMGGTGDVLFEVPDVLIDLGSGLQTVTDEFGSFRLDALYPGDYLLTWQRSDLSLEKRTITLGEGQSLGLNLEIWPVTEYRFESTTVLPIPDEDTAGVVSTIQVSNPGRVSRLDVDLQVSHTWRGDLLVCLVSPTGTRVRLHNRGGSSYDDIIGNYPQTLTVSGPGSLDDFHDQEIHGAWRLQVIDMQASDTGSLLGWSLNLSAADLQTSDVPDNRPLRDRLHQNVPNPFNPLTVIRFETGRPATPQLTVYDLRGRRVRRLLADKLMPAGVHDVTWDGRDDEGRSAPSGLYVYRLAVEGQTAHRKMLLAR